MTRFALTARGPFSLAAGTRFLEGFTPAGYTGAQEGVLDLAFPVEGGWRTVGVRVRQDGDGVVVDVVRAGVAKEYGLLSAPSSADLVRISEGWRPYRSWVALLLRVRLEELQSTMPP